MIKLVLSQEQMNNFFKCLDAVLKADGLKSLAMVTDLHNVCAVGLEQFDLEKKRKQKQYDSKKKKGEKTPTE